MDQHTLDRRRLLAGLAAAAAVMGAAPAIAQPIYQPPAGSAERRAILDAIRPAIEPMMRGPVEFVVQWLAVSGQWAFVSAYPQRPGGTQIDPRQTAFADDIGFMDGLQVYALARYWGGRWNHVEHVVGPTDVAYGHWPKYYGIPPGLLGL